MKFRQKINETLSRTPMWRILAILMFLVFLVVSVFMTLQLYIRETREAIATEERNLQEFSDLRLMNIDNYFDELSQFSVGPCYDSTVYQMLIGGKSVNKETAQNVATDFVYYNYYARSDMVSYYLTFLDQNFSVGRGLNAQHITTISADTEEIRNSVYFTQCESSSRNYTVVQEEGTPYIHYYHTLVRVDDGKAVGLVSMLLQPGFAINSTDEDGRYYCVVNESGDIFYSTLPGETTANDAAAYVAKLSADQVTKNSNTIGIVTLDDTDYLAASSTNGDFGLTVYSFSNRDALLARQQASLRSVLVNGLLFCILLYFVTIWFLRKLTRPLSILSDKLLSFGEGNFEHTDVKGSKEIADLSASYNKMTDSMQRLIQQNYTAKLAEQKARLSEQKAKLAQQKAGLSEQRARLTALEAQVNPHFLYNSLQAIGSAALMKDDTDVYHMLNDLADCLRYTLRKSSVVPLEQELTYADTYFRLQKLRKRDHIFMEKNIDEGTLSLDVPKVSIQSLVENAIEHGLEGEATSIHILLEASKNDSILTISVTDDGCGMAEEEVQRLNRLCHSAVLTDESIGIGIPNLYNRLQILYKDAEISIQSSTGKEDHGTKISLLLPLHYEEESTEM